MRPPIRIAGKGTSSLSAMFRFKTRVAIVIGSSCCLLCMGALAATSVTAAHSAAPQTSSSPSQNSPSQPYDVIIRNGRVIDGSGNPWFSADVGVRGGKIAAIGDLHSATGAKVIDAKG